jgi:hypothetical protein
MTIDGSRAMDRKTADQLMHDSVPGRREFAKSAGLQPRNHAKRVGSSSVTRPVPGGAPT